jgi:hypothetical protein
VAQVPYSGVPTVSPQTSVPDDYQRIQTDPGQFGGLIAQGLEKAGAGALKAGQFYGEVAADDATNQYMEGSRKILKGDPNDIWRDETGQPILDEHGQTQPDRGFYGLQGEAAMRAQAGVEAKLENLRKQLHENMATPEQQLMFEHATRRMQDYQSLQIGSHADQQANVWASKVEAASTANAKAEIASAVLSGDQAEVTRHSNDLVGNHVRGATRLGARPGDEVWNAAVQRGKQEAIETQVNALLPSNPAAAQKLFNDNVPLLSGLPNFDALNNRITNYADRHIGQQAGRDAFFGAGAAGGSFRASPGAPIAGATPDEQKMLNEIRHRESGGDYTIENREGSDATGGFQFRDATWRQATQATGLGSQYSRAKDAPKEIQDANALWLLRSQGTQPWAASGPYPALTIGGPSVRLASAGEQQAAAGPRAPTREEIIGRLPEGLSENAYNHAYAEANRLYTHWEQATSSDRAQLKQLIRNGIPMLEDGRDFDYDPNRIRSLLPPDQADQAIDLLEDAKTVGQQKMAVRGMSMPEAMAQSAANQAQLAKAPPGEYVKMKKMADAFDKASDQHFKALFADPAGYLTATNPEIERLRQAVTAEQPDQAAALRGAGQPTAFEKYAAALTEEQDRLGVPPESQHVLGVAGAPKVAQDIMANPSQAPTKIRQMEQGYGTAWPAVWNDLATLGKMPTGYQALGVLEEADAEQFARGLGAGKEGKAWHSLLGTTVVNDIEKEVRGDDGVQKLLTSLRIEGASPTQIADFLGTINTLAFTKQMEGDTAPGANAAKAFTSLYGFMPNGGARVPAKQFDAVAANAQATLRKLSADNLTIPAGFGAAQPLSGPGMLTAGNIDLDHRPHIQTPEGKTATVRSASFNIDGNEVLLPTVSDDGRLLSNDQALEQYRKTGKMLGIFDTPEHATDYAQRLHEAQAATLGRQPGMPTPDDYVRLIQAAPTWVNTQGDSLVLMSGSPLSRIVRDKAGNPISVKFSTPAPPQTTVTTPPAIGLGP